MRPGHNHNIITTSPSFRRAGPFKFAASFYEPEKVVMCDTQTLCMFMRSRSHCVWQLCFGCFCLAEASTCKVAADGKVRKGGLEYAFETRVGERFVWWQRSHLSRLQPHLIPRRPFALYSAHIYTLVNSGLPSCVHLRQRPFTSPFE